MLSAFSTHRYANIYYVNYMQSSGRSILKKKRAWLIIKTQLIRFLLS